MDRFRPRNNIVFYAVSGVCVDISVDVDVWKNCLPSIAGGHSVSDSFNIDKVPLLFRTLPDKTLTATESWTGGKLSKEL